MKIEPAVYAIKVLGGQQAVATIIGVTRQTVQRFKERGNIPRKHFLALVTAARARGVDLTYEDLAIGRNMHKREWDAA